MNKMGAKQVTNLWDEENSLLTLTEKKNFRTYQNWNYNEKDKASI